MIELAGRAHVGIDLARGIDEYRVGIEPYGLKQRGEQRVLVLAITVCVLQHLGGSVRLVAPDPKGNADVAEV